MRIEKIKQEIWFQVNSHLNSPAIYQKLSQMNVERN